MSEPAFAQLLWQRPAAGVVRVVMNKPERRNAQGVPMTYELDRAVRHACHDDEIAVIILAAAGDHFSSGHYLGADERPMPLAEECLGLWGQFNGPGWEGMYARERELYFDAIERLRNAPKPTIAEVRGACVAGGNMLAWACDLIICSDDAKFKDGLVDMAMPGAEVAGYPWEVGSRKAKEWLFTGDWLGADDAHALGMVNQVVPKSDLESFTLSIANKIAAKDRFTLKLIKESLNSHQDATGRREALRTSFYIHQIGHLHNMLTRGFLVDASRLPPSVQAAFEELKSVLPGSAMSHR